VQSPSRILIVLAFVTSVGPVAGAADVTAAADINTAYVWRGITFSKGGNIQPSLDVSGFELGVPLALNVWGNFNFSNWEGRVVSDEVSEIDVTLTGTLPAGFKAAYINYIFTVGGTTDFTKVPEPSTQELMVSWSHTYGVTPGVALYYDVGAIRDFFLLLSVARDFAVLPKTKVTGRAEVGIAGGDFARYYSGTKGGLYHYNLYVKGTYAVSKTASVGVSVGYTAGFSEDVLPRDKPGFYGPYAGVSVSLGL
jgi:hypothetical protein